MVNALIVIDMLEGYMKDTHNPKKIIKNIVKLIKEFKKRKKIVILSVPDFNYSIKNPVMIKLWGEEFKNDPQGRKLIKELSHFKYDKIVKKHEYSTFYDTDFEKYCKQNKIDELYFTGVFSGCCVLFSAVDSAYRHIQPYLVTDAAGGPRKSLVDKNWHKNTCDSFKLMIGPLITTNKLIHKLEQLK